MSRIRSIKPGAFRHEDLCDLEDKNPQLRVFATFFGLMTQADKAGRFEWNPRVLKLDVLPFVTYDLGATMDLLGEHGFLQKYEVAGKVYGCFPTWTKHQRPHKQEPPSVIPLPPDPHQTISDVDPTNDERTGIPPSPTVNAPQTSPDSKRREMRQGNEIGNEIGNEAGGRKQEVVPNPAPAAAALDLNMPEWMSQELKGIGIAFPHIESLLQQLGLDGLQGALYKLRVKGGKENPAGLLLRRGPELAQEGRALLEKNLKRALALLPESPIDSGWAQLLPDLRDDLEVATAWCLLRKAEQDEGQASEHMRTDSTTARCKAEDLFISLIEARHPDAAGLRARADAATRDAPAQFRDRYRRCALFRALGLTHLKPASGGL